jgi:hypothetical protein
MLSRVAMARTEPETAARLLGNAEERFRQQTVPRDFWVEVNPEWFLYAGRLARLVVDQPLLLRKSLYEERLCRRH